MLRCRPLITLGLIALAIFSVSCSQTAREDEMRAEKAKVAAEEFFTTFSAQSPEIRSSWDMSDFHVFGRGSLFGWVAIAAGQTEVRK